MDKNVRLKNAIIQNVAWFVIWTLIFGIVESWLQSIAIDIYNPFQLIASKWFALLNDNYALFWFTPIAIGWLFIAKRIWFPKVVLTKSIETKGSEADELKKYAELKDQGIITEEEFQAKKKQILGL
tara:strand:+ start:65 stop:442 length:378 start_codon:yes stop_codon:yes gene_type:complete